MAEKRDSAPRACVRACGVMLEVNYGSVFGLVGVLLARLRTSPSDVVLDFFGRLIHHVPNKLPVDDVFVSKVSMCSANDVEMSNDTSNLWGYDIYVRIITLCRARFNVHFLGYPLFLC